MPLYTMDLMQQVYETILAAYTQPPMKGLPPGNREGDIFLTINWPGLKIDEQQYGNAWSPQNPTGSQDAVENISILVNSIPTLNPQYEWSGNSVESVYEQILDARPIRAASGSATTGARADKFAASAPSVTGAEASAPNVMSVDTSAFMKEVGSRDLVSVTTEEGKPVELVSVTDDAFKESELEAAYSDAAANLNAKRMQYNLSDPAQKQQWETVAPAYEAAVQSAWNALESHRSQQSLKSSSQGSSLLRVATSNSAGVSASAKESDSTGASDSDDAGVSDDPVLRSFLQAKNIFKNSRLASAKNAALSYHPTYVTPANFADPKAASSWLSIQILPTAIQSSTGKANSKISFKFARVNFVRPWLMMSLLKMSGWQVQGMSPGFLSNGMNEDNYGQFALLPTAMIVVRDLVISPVGVNTSDTDSYQVLNDPGLQVLAWINKIVPFSPPAK